MRRIVLVLSCVVVLAAALPGTAGAGSVPAASEGTITISGAWALYPMVVTWAEQYQKLYPKVRIDVAAGGAGKGMADCLGGMVDIGMISRDVNPAEVEKGAFWVSVTRDAVVPVVNGANPALTTLIFRGAKREALVGLWVTGETKTWGQVAGNDVAAQVNVYTRSDACGAAETWAAYLGKKQEDLLGVGVYGDPGLADAVKRDVLGIGFNNLNYAYDGKTLKPIEGIRVLPLDINGNGVLDDTEDFYKTRDELANAIATGVYPSPPARDLHFASKGRPTSPVVVQFIRWVLTDGQAFVPDAGYITLPKEKLAAQLEKLGSN
jgi:phosphate transport system substrate-binding protein